MRVLGFYITEKFWLDVKFFFKFGFMMLFDCRREFVIHKAICFDGVFLEPRA